MKIRFRVWHEREKKMWYPGGREEYFINMEGELCKTVDSEYYGEWSESTGPFPGEYMLSTGYKDKDEVEIWAGDVIQGINDEQIVEGKVFWDEERQTWCVSGYISYELRNVYSRHICGNVYENPELVK